MKIEIQFFSDGRLKVLRIHNKSDENVRIDKDEVSVCSKIRELKLEKEVLEAVNLWNMMKVMPELREDIEKALKDNLGKGLDDLLDLWS